MTTKISDVIVPEIFNPYVIQKTMELSALVSSGIISAEAIFDALASGGGKTVNMPYWTDLSGDSEVLSDSGALTPEKIGSAQDVAVILRRGKAWGVNDLAANLAGDDPMRAIGDLVAAYWSRDLQTTLIKILTGVFGAASMSGNVSDISAGVGDAAKISASAIVDAFQLLGDAKSTLTGIMMHSAVEAALSKQDLITTIRNSEGKVVMKSYMEKQVIVDDGCPVTDGTYSTFLFGAGAFALGNGNPVGFVPTETDRDSLAGEDYLINRKTLILHPRGVAFTGTPAGSSPTNTELATGTNWTRKYANKAIRVVQFKHKI